MKGQGSPCLAFHVAGSGKVTVTPGSASLAAVVMQTLIFHRSHLQTHRCTGGTQQAMGAWWHLTVAPRWCPRQRCGSWEAGACPNHRGESPSSAGAGHPQLRAAGARGAVSLLPSPPQRAAVSRKSFHSCCSLLSRKVNVSLFYLSDRFFYVTLQDYVGSRRVV